MTAAKTLITIVVPCYNSARTIQRTLDTILKQTYETLEIIVVDDGSTDDTSKIVKSIQDPRIKLIKQENAGVSVARNTGIEVATGKYVLFVDSDDRIEDTMVEKMLAKISKHPKSLVVCGKMIGKNKISVSQNITVSKNLTKHVVTSILKNGHLYSPCNKIYNFDIIKSQNVRFMKNVAFGEDLIFNLDYLRYADSVSYLKECLYHYDMSAAGSSHRTKSQYKYRIVMLDALRKYLGDDIKKPDVALKYNLIRLRWRISTVRAKLKQGK